MSPNMVNSTTVDERIVEMRIDNSKFEDGAKKTINILEKLDKALHLHTETDEIDKLTDAVGKFDVSPMASGLDSLQHHFSALEIAGMRVISNLTDSVYNFTARTVKGLSIDQVTAGWSKYEDKTSAVQTIMAATRKDIGTLYADEAEQMAAVNEQLEKLNWFTDETSYSFLDMVNNIGKFTSNGRRLDESVTAMMGISTWAAISGAKVQEAGRAMYNLSQALGTGSVQVRDWMSIENANMATYEFKQMAIETAEALGTLQKKSDGVWESLAGHEVTIEGFRENLKDDWFTSDVLLETLQNYGNFTEALKIATDETDTTATEFLRAMRRFEEGEDVDEELIPWIQELSKAEYDLGRRAFQAAQEAKTFTEAIDATKDAVSTGWMNSFEKIFGDYRTAKTFWTDIANDLWDIFAGGGESRNTMLDVAFGKVNKAIDGNETVVQAKNAWSEFEDQLNDAGLSMDDFRESYEKVIAASEDDALKKLIEEGYSIEDVFRKGAISGKTFKDILNDLTGKAKETAQASGEIDLSGNMETKLDEYKALIPKIMRGDFGNGEERKAAIEALGYNYEIAQKLAEWSYLGYNTELEQLAQEFPSLVEMMRDEMVANGTITEEELARINALLNDTDATLAKLQNETGNISDKTVGNTQKVIDRGELFRKSLVNILDTIIIVKNIVNEAFETVFGTAEERGEALGLLVERFYEITEYIKTSNNMASDSRKGLVSIFEVIFRIAHLMTRIVGIGFRLITNVIGVAYRLIEKIFAVIGRMRKETDEIGKASIFDMLESVLDTVEAISLTITSILHSILDSKMAQSVFSALTSGLTKLSEWFSTARSYTKSVIEFLEPAVGLLLMALAGIASFAASHVFTAIVAVFNAVVGLPSSIANFVSSSQLLSSIWLGISETFDKVRNNLKKGWNFVRGIFENKGFTEAIKGLRTWASDMLGKVFPNLATSFENFNLKLVGEGSILESIISGIGTGLAGIGGLFVVVFGGLLNLITGLIKGLQGVNFNAEKIAEGFNDFYEIVKLIFNGLFGDPTEFKERISNFVTTAWEGFKESMEKISIRDALKALRLSFVFVIGARILSVLSMVKKIGEEAASIPESISGAIKSGGRVLDSIGKSFQANAIIKMAVATGIVAMALYGLSKIPEEKLTHAAAVISVVMIIMTLLANSFNKISKYQNINIKKFSVFGDLGGALLGLGVAIGAFAYGVVKIAQLDDPNRLWYGVAIIGGFIALASVIMMIFGKQFAKLDTNGFKLEATSKILKGLGKALLSIAFSVVMLTVPILALAAASAYIEQKNGSKWNVWGAMIGIAGLILSFALAMNILISAVRKVGDDKAIKSTGSALWRIGLGVMFMSHAISSLVLPILVLTYVFAKLNANPDTTTAVVWQALGVLGSIFGAFAAFFLLFAVITRKMNGFQLQHLGNSILKMGASMLLISFAIKSVAFTMLEIMAVLSLLTKLEWETDWKTSLTILGWIAGGLLAFAAIMGAISLIPFETTKLLAMATVLMAFGIAMLFVTPLIVLFTAAVAAILYYTKDILDFGAAIKKVSQTAGVLLKIGIAALAFGAGISFLGSGILKAAAAILLLSVSVNIIVKAIEALVTHQDDMSKFWKKLNEWLTADNIWKLAKIAGTIAVITIGVLALIKGVTKLASVLKLINVGGSLGSKFSNMFSSLGTNLPKLLHNAFSKASTYLVDHFDDILPALILALSIIGSYLIGIIPQLSKDLVKAVATLLQSLAQELKSNKDILIGSITSIANTIFDIFSEVLENVFIKGYKDRNFIGKLMTWIVGGMVGGFGVLTIIKAVTAIVNGIYAATRLGTLFKGKNGGTLSGIGNSVINVANAVINVANATMGPGGMLGNSIPLLPGAQQVSTKEAILATTKAIPAMVAPFALAIGGITLASKGLNKFISNNIYKKAFDGLGDTVDDSLIALGRINEDINELKNEQARLTTLTEDEKQLAEEQYRYYNPNATDSEIQEYLKEEEASKAKSNADRLDQLAIKIRQHEEVISAIYEDLASTLGISKEKIDKYMQMYDDPNEALEAAQRSKIDTLLAPFLKSGMREDAFSALLDIGNMLSKDENIKSMLTKNLAANNLGEDMDTAIGHILSGKASISSAQAALYAILQDAYNDPTTRTQVVNILKKSGLSEDLSTAMRELGMDAIKNNQYTQAFVDSLKQIAEDENVRNQINANYSEVGKLIDHAIAGTITKDDFSNKLLLEFARMKNDAELMKAIEESCPQLGEFITHMVSSKIENTEVATKLVESLREAMSHEEIRNLIQSEYPELGNLINSTVAGSIDKDDLSPEIMTELSNLARDPDVLSVIQTSYPDLGRALTQSILDGITIDDLAKGIMDKVNTAMNDPTVQSGIGHGQNILGTALNDAGYGGIAQLIQNGDWTSLLLKGLDAVIPKEDTAYREMYNMLEAGIQGAAEGSTSGLTTVGQQLWNQYGDSCVEAITNALGDDELATTAAANLGQYIGGAFGGPQGIDSNSPSKLFSNIAKWIPAGVAQGIYDNLQVAFNAGVALANAVNQGYRQTLKINSPSRVFEALSKYIPEGVALGINNNKEPAITAVIGLSSAILDAAHRAMMQASYVASDEFEFNPSITPVIDLTQARTSSAEFSRLFSNAAASVNMRPQNNVRMPDNSINYNITNQNRDVVNEIHRLSDLMTQLGEEITNMKIVLNTGILVGELAPAMNDQLGTLSHRERRQ